MDLRKRIEARNKRVMEKNRPSPSERKSKNMRRKLNRDVKEYKPPQSDCRDCDKYKECRYDHDLNKCPVQSIVHCCKKCGIAVRYRWIQGEVWEYCPVCRG